MIKGTATIYLDNKHEDLSDVKIINMICFNSYKFLNKAFWDIEKPDEEPEEPSEVCLRKGCEDIYPNGCAGPCVDYTKANSKWLDYQRMKNEKVQN